MEVEILGAIAAVASAVVAVGAAVSAKRSADRSAAAEERSAKAAEDSVEIERQRLSYELDDRAGASAPKLDVGEKHGLRWSLAQGGRALVGYIENHGPSAATVESVALRGPNKPVVITAVDEAWDGFLGVNDGKQVCGPWPFDAPPQEPLSIIVMFGAADGSGYRAEAEFTLRRDGADPNGQLLWRSAETRIRRL